MNSLPQTIESNNILLSPLTQEEIAQDFPILSTKKGKYTPILPVPKNAPEIQYTNPQLGGKPDVLYPFHNKEGELLCYVARWEATTTKNGKKEIRALCYARDERGLKRWRACGIPAPRPLFNLHLLAENPQKPILVCEGEKTAIAAQQLFPEYTATTPMHGAQSPHKTDWGITKGRNVIIAPDYDDAGRCFAESVATLCQNAGAASVREIHLQAFGQTFFEEGTPSTRDIIPEGYDLADAVAEGWTSAQVDSLINAEALLTPILVENESLEAKRAETKRFDVSPSGVYYLRESKDEYGFPLLEWVWMCSFLQVTHQTRDNEGGNWGRLCLLVDNDSNSKEYVLPMEATGASGEEYRRHLLSLGLVLAPRCNEKLHEYLVTSRTNARAICVPCVGWHKGQYVLAGKVIGTGSGERLVLQTKGTPPVPFATKGTLEQWQQSIGRYAVGNSRLLLAISAALASGVMSLVQEENAALHWWGSSSIGKTTIAQVIGSIWNRPVQSWRTTDNAAESLAIQANDGVLILDELGQVDAQAADALAYMLGNGQGKGRANRAGEARPIAKFRLLVISTGEMDLGNKMAEKKLPAKAGQLVRFISLPADAGRGHGIFEELHGFADGASFSNYLKKSTNECRGSVILGFLERVAQHPDDIAQAIIKAKKAWLEKALQQLQGVDGQVQRVAAKFSFIAAVGELAATMGIMPWPENAASNACMVSLKEWIVQRGGVDAQENNRAVETLQAFINRYGSSRFETPWDNSTASASNLRSLDRAGFRKQNEEASNWEYYIFPEVFRKEICEGCASASIAAYLADNGYLQRDRQGKTQVSVRVPHHKQQRLYHIPANAFASMEDTIDA